MTRNQSQLKTIIHGRITIFLVSAQIYVVFEDLMLKMGVEIWDVSFTFFVHCVYVCKLFITDFDQ